MAISVMVCYIPECDTCGFNFEWDYIPHFDNLAEARQGVRDLNGAIWGDAIWCENCIPPCTCGHSLLEHDHGDAPCDECECAEYAPAEGKGA